MAPSLFACCSGGGAESPRVAPRKVEEGQGVETGTAAAGAAEFTDAVTAAADANANANANEGTAAASPSAAPILYGNAGSTCVQCVRFTAFEKGVELDFRNLDWPESKSPEHLKRQPLGKFPAMEHDGLTFHESRAICLYLEERFRDRGVQLVPTGLKPHTTFNMWLSLESTEILPPLYEIISQRIWGTWRGLTPNEEVIAKSVELSKAGLDYLEKQLTGRDYILGDFSLIDIFFAPYIKLLMTLPEKTLIESRPNVLAWWQRVSARPGYAASQPPSA